MDWIVQTEQLTKTFGQVTAVDNLSLKVPKGSVYGFLGPNGAGKTTTILMLLGITRPSSGSATVLGQKVCPSPDYRSRIGFLPDVPDFYNWMRAEEFLMLTGRLFSMPPAKLKERIAHLLDVTGLAGVKTRIGGYSRGMKQRLGLAQALINDPELIFLDEPTSALDPIGRKEMLETIKTLAATCTVFFSTHILSDVERICDRVGVLNHGRLIIDESISDLRARYAQSAVELEIDGDVAALEKKLAAQPWSDLVERTEEKILVTTNDLNRTKLEIPRLLADMKMPLRRFEPVELTLEDIFVRLVNDDEK